MTEHLPGSTVHCWNCYSPRRGQTVPPCCYPPSVPALSPSALPLPMRSPQALQKQRRLYDGRANGEGLPLTACWRGTSTTSASIPILRPAGHRDLLRMLLRLFSLLHRAGSQGPCSRHCPLHFQTLSEPVDSQLSQEDMFISISRVGPRSGTLPVISNQALSLQLPGLSAAASKPQRELEQAMSQTNPITTPASHPMLPCSVWPPGSRVRLNSRRCIKRPRSSARPRRSPVHASIVHFQTNATPVHAPIALAFRFAGRP